MRLIQLKEKSETITLIMHKTWIPQSSSRLSSSIYLSFSSSFYFPSPPSVLCCLLCFSLLNLDLPSPLFLAPFLSSFLVFLFPAFCPSLSSSSFSTSLSSLLFFSSLSPPLRLTSCQWCTVGTGECLLLLCEREGNSLFFFLSLSLSS